MGDQAAREALDTPKMEKSNVHNHEVTYGDISNATRYNAHVRHSVRPIARD